MVPLEETNPFTQRDECSMFDLRNIWRFASKLRPLYPAPTSHAVSTKR